MPVTGLSARLEAVGVEHLAAAHVERLLVGVAPVVARGEAVLDEADAAFVDAHLAAGDARLGQADEARLGFALDAQHEGAAVHAFEPVPVLAEPGVAVGGRRAGRRPKVVQPSGPTASSSIPCRPALASLPNSVKASS